MKNYLKIVVRKLIEKRGPKVWLCTKYTKSNLAFTIHKESMDLPKTEECKSEKSEIIVWAQIDTANVPKINQIRYNNSQA